MNIEQVRAAAEAKISHSRGSSCVRIFVGSSVPDSSADRIVSLFQSAIDQGNFRASIVRTGSFGCYDLEPIVRVEKPGLDDILFMNVTPDGVGSLINDLSKATGDIPNISELPLFNLQKRIALRNCGWIDPEDINHYICYGQGYTSLSRALKMNPLNRIETLMRSALKGRGRPGCSAPDKWKAFAEAENADTYLICNAVDPDPGSMTSRLLLESDPHSVLEGMLISACAVRASHCFIYVEEKTEGCRRLRKALDQSRTYNLLGSNILDSQFCTEIEIVEAPASLITGHRIEMFRCAEEKQPPPHMSPACPGASVFIGKPVLMVNPEMMACLSAVLDHNFNDGKRAKVLTLSGSVEHKHTVEVPVETTIRNIIECFGGGVLKGKAIKAVQLGKPAGVFLAPKDLDLSIEHDGANQNLESIEVMDDDASILDLTKDVMAYIQMQSCGKCVFCREGCLQMLTILEDISETKGKSQDLNLLVELGEEMRTACLCEFGRSAPNPVLSSIRLFRAEYEGHR
jgi:NADH-quinone oxidoreductase subunit F